MRKIKRQIILTLSLVILVLAVCSASAAAETPNNGTSMQTQDQSAINHNSNATSPTKTSITNTKPAQTSTADQLSKTDATDTGSTQTNATDQPSKVVISGQVKKCSDGTPFEGVTVTAEEDGTKLASTTTGMDGTYSLEFPCNSGVYNVTASYPGHNPSSKEVTVNPDSNGTFQGTADFQLGLDDVYVNSLTGNDAWDGSSPTFQGDSIGPKQTIQAGISAVNPGGTVHLADGTYTVPAVGIPIPYSLNIVGESQANTIINGAGTTNGIFTIPAGATVTMQDLTLENGNNLFGGAIANGGTLTVNDCTFTSNSATDGGAIYNFPGSILTVNDCTFTSNSATNGGAIFNSGGATTTVTGSTFTGNTASAGAGAIFNNGTLTVNGSTFTSNSATDGGAIDNSGGTLTVNDSTFTGNTATLTGGAISNFGTLTVNGSTFTSNIGNFNGGAIFNVGTLTVENNSKFTGNSATNGFGGAIDNSGGTLTVDSSTFTSNIASEGGAIFNFGGTTTTVTGSTFTTNHASAAAGAIYNDIGTLTVNGSTFTGNTAGSNGGAIYNEGGTLNVNSNNFLFNIAGTAGGAIYSFGGDITNRNVHFNRIVSNSPANSEVVSDVGTLDARFNWWGSNSSPAGKIATVNGGVVVFDPWLVLSITVNPTTILNGGTSQVTADLLHDSNGVFHDPASGHVPDGIPITLNILTWGSFTNPGNTDTITLGTVNGAVTAIFFANEGPTPRPPLNPVLVTATADDQTVSTFITILEPPVPPVPSIIGSVLNPAASINALLTNTQAQAQTSNNVNNNNSANINIIDPINYIGNISALSAGNNFQIQAIRLLKVFEI